MIRRGLMGRLALTLGWVRLRKLWLPDPPRCTWGHTSKHPHTPVHTYAKNGRVPDTSDTNDIKDIVGT